MAGAGAAAFEGAGALFSWGLGAGAATLFSGAFGGLIGAAAGGAFFGASLGLALPSILSLDSWLLPLATFRISPCSLLACEAFSRFWSCF